MITAEVVAEHLAEVHTRILNAGGDLDAVQVLAVTKGFGTDAVSAAMEAGLRSVGENYAQELLAKHRELSDAGATQPEWHFIGQLQRNKVRQLAAIVDVWQSVDNVALVHEIAKRAPGARMFVQVNLTPDPARGGCGFDDVQALIDAARSEGLEVLGLMAVAPLPEEGDAQGAFAKLKETADSLGLRQLSMGMSGDLEAAVRAGSSMVRIGSGLFGGRPLRRAAGD